MQRGQSCYEHRGRPVGSPNAPADHIESCTNHDPPSTEEVGQSARCKEGGTVMSIEGGQWGVQMLQQTTSSPAPTMILPVQRKFANLADVSSALILPSEEQYSKCMYPLCFDFSQCPLTQPFHVFVYGLFPLCQFPLCQFPLCQFPLRQFPFGQLPTLSIPILSTSHFVNSHFVNFPLCQFPFCQFPFGQC